MEILLAVISVTLILTVFISLVRKDFWVYKVLEYPRLQKLVLLFIVTASWFFFWPLQKVLYQIILGGLVVSIIYLVYKIWPYTRLAKKEMIRVQSNDPENEFKIFSANVLQDNTQYDTMLKHIKSTDPDVIFLLETNSAWYNATKKLKKEYPYTVLEPLENTYGLLLYSRLELKDAKVLYLVKKDIPSIDAILVLPSGQEVQIWGLHPEPPVPGESLYSTAKDKELMKVAIKAKECKLPCIVFGDLNDVAWSHTTELFRKTSNLLDPRRGRGFYSTFSAHHWFIRFPLDYIFCSKEFSLISMRRLPKCGSDHFATITHLALRKDLTSEQDPPEADKEEIKEAHKIAEQPVKQ
jgi:endonuclease/exonuclease/phosphatase (EEP) superfamily protein YafD